MHLLVSTSCFHKLEATLAKQTMITLTVRTISLISDHYRESAMTKAREGSLMFHKLLCTGQLPDLIDVIIEEKTSLFVCAVGAYRELPSCSSSCRSTFACDFW